MGPAPPWVGYGYVGRKYSLLGRPLDVVPDCHPAFGLGKHALLTSRRRMVTPTLTVCERGNTVYHGVTHVDSEYRGRSRTSGFKRSDRGAFV